jgi:hypothetical protein
MSGGHDLGSPSFIEVAEDGIADLGLELAPRIGLRKDRSAQRPGRVAPIGGLLDDEDRFLHNADIPGRVDEVVE